jgi:hypothetical protein
MNVRNTLANVQHGVRWPVAPSGARGPVEVRVGRGKWRTIREWANYLGIPASRIWGRLDMGWPIDRALTTPKLNPWRRAVCGHTECVEDERFAIACAQAERDRLRKLVGLPPAVRLPGVLAQRLADAITRTTGCRPVEAGRTPNSP